MASAAGILSSSTQYLSVFKYVKEQPRDPKGVSTGGQFASSDTGTSMSSDPTLAKQAKEGIAAIEKLIPAAVTTADFSEVRGAWEDLNEDVREQVRKYYEETTYDYTSMHMNTYELDHQVSIEIEVGKRAAILDEAKKRLGYDYPTIDPKTIQHDETYVNEPGLTTLLAKNLRHLDGSPLTANEQEDARVQWHERYDNEWKRQIEIYKDSDEYLARREKEVLQHIDASWKSLDQQRRIELARELQDRGEISIDDTSRLQKEPAQWVTGVEKGAHDEDNYARTHALALKLTEMRTDEIREERGLFHTGVKPEYTIVERPEAMWHAAPVVAKAKDGHIVALGKNKLDVEIEAEQWAVGVASRNAIPTEKIIKDVWDQWKRSSSQDLSLSLQLAAARELGGHHRLTPDEVEQAELSAQPYGGIPTLQAYVRAQWEVTQTIMQKAGEDRIKVYRGLMLDGADVKATKHELVDPSGLSLQKPVNVRVEQHGTRETVAFDFNGEYLTVEKDRVQTPYEWRDVDPAVKKQVTDAWEKNVREVLAEQKKEHPTDPGYTFEKGMRLFEKMSDRAKRSLLDDWRLSGIVPVAPFESTEETVNRHIEDYVRGKRNVFAKLPDLSLKRGGAQSTTGTRDVANDWGGVGDLPPDPERVVIRIEAPPTSALSLPVYGANEQSEHETVVLGTPDHWLWDAWHGKAPDFSTPIQTTASKAERKKLVIDLQAADRGKPHWLSQSFGQSSAKYDRVFKKAPLPVDKKTFDESKVVRDPKGTSTGGQFASSGHSGVAAPDPKLAKEAAAGIAAVEKLIPEALRTADFSDTGEPTEWSELSQDAQSETYDKWTQDAYDDVQVDTSQLREDAERDLRQDNQEVLDAAYEDTLEAFKVLHFTDDDPALDVGGEGFLLRKTLDPDTLDYGDGDDHDGYVTLNVDALRFMNGDKLSDVEQQRVVDEWDERYARAMRNALEEVTQSDHFMEQVSEMESDAISEQWSNMSDAEKFQAASDHSIAMTRQVEPREPDTWTTGVEKGDHTDDDYARTHALALRLTEMRTDELRKERGLLEPGPRPAYTIRDTSAIHGTPTFVIVDKDGHRIGGSTTLEQATVNAEAWATDQSTKASRVSTETMITGLWNQWKVSSSEGTSLSLQLAAALELGGHHRLLPGELITAREEAERYGGLPTLQAYVRAQWEVTQTIMKKAGEDRIKVYRGLMLAGADVDATRHEIVDKFGTPPSKPTNITASINPPTGKPIVSFDYNGEHFVVEKQPVVPYQSILDIGDGRAVESDDAAVQRRISKYIEEAQQRHLASGNAFVKLPDIKLQRAGAQSTTGTRQVANDWGGVGNRPVDAKRVVLRVEAPATSAFSLPVYGANEQSEHETVVVGTQDKWLWDAWLFAAPDFESQNITVVAHKADTVPLVIDLQAEDRGKPHWLSGLQSIAKFDPALHPKGPDGRFVDAEGVTHVGDFVELYHGTSRLRANKILKEGFKIRAVAKQTMGGDPESSRNYIWLAKRSAAAQSYSEMHGRPAVLTVRLPRALYEKLKLHNSGPDSVWSPESIPPKYISPFQPTEKAAGIGGITKKFDPALHPKGPDGRFIESSQPRIFNRLSDVEPYESWGNKQWQWRKETPKSGFLLTGEPISREQLPETLYHVTTNAPAVESSGVLLGQLGDTGLGGGQAEGVSFTSSKEDAAVILRELKRAVLIARGEVDIDVIEQWAREDEHSAGLPEGTLNHAVTFSHSSWDVDAPNMGKTHYWDKDAPEGERYKEGPPASPAEKERVRRSLLKDALNAYLIARDTVSKDQNVPSLKNPILFGRQEHLAKLDPANIQILEVPSSQIPLDALVTTGSDKFLHEVRAYSDVPVRRRALKYEEVFKRGRFVEAQHPRNKEGEFAYSGEAATWGAPHTPAEKARIKALGIPPAWKHVRINPDPKADMQVVGIDIKGEQQYKYSAAHTKRAGAQKFKRLQDFTRDRPAILDKIRKDLENPDTSSEDRDAAAVLYLIALTGFRPGSKQETKGDVKARGASTLRPGDVEIHGSTIKFSFIGKHGVRNKKTITDPLLAKILGPRDKPRSREPLFPDTSDAAVRKYMRTVSPKKAPYTPKDFRTWHGTGEALKVLKTMKRAKTEKEFKKKQREVAEKVAKQLSNTAAVVIKSYIDPAAWSSLRPL